MNSPTIEKPKHMRPGAMADLHLQHVKNNRRNACTPDGRPAILTAHERENRQNQKTGRSINQAGFRQKAGIGEVDFTTARNLDENLFKRLATPGFLSRNENLIITGAQGLYGSKGIAQTLDALRVQSWAQPLTKILTI
jgi:hypothetical protein